MSRHQHVLTFVLSVAFAVLAGGFLAKYTAELLPWILLKSFLMFCLSTMAVSAFFQDKSKK